MQNTIFSMLTENTGSHMLDSGGAYGRHWEKNKKKTLADFIKEPSVIPYNITDEKKSNEVCYTISVFHYLTNGQIKLDNTCKAFNKLPCEDWDGGETYGISKKQSEWLKKRGFEFKNSFNTYNGESSLSQVLQGTYLKKENDTWVLLQIHNGCDVRGGYTDAKLFYLPEDFLPGEDVIGTIDGKEVENLHDGINLTDENGNPVNIKKNSKIDLNLIY